MKRKIAFSKRTYKQLAYSLSSQYGVVAWLIGYILFKRKETSCFKNLMQLMAQIYAEDIRLLKTFQSGKNCQKSESYHLKMSQGKTLMPYHLLLICFEKGKNVSIPYHHCCC